jgi:tetratricopeptide (TPR) repeat protein
MNKYQVLVTIIMLALTPVFAGFEEDKDAAEQLVREGKRGEALAAYMKMAEGAGNEMQKSEALRRAAICAWLNKDPGRAAELAKSIPVAAVSKTSQMDLLTEGRKYKELLDQFKSEDIESWPESVKGDAFRMRGEAANICGDAQLAAADLEKAAANLKENYYHNRALLALGGVYKTKLKNEDKAIEIFRRVKLTGQMPSQKYRADWEIADIYMGRGKFKEALELLDAVDLKKSVGDLPMLVLSSQGKALAGLGKNKEAAEKYNLALKAQGVTPALRQEFENAFDELITSSPDQLVLAGRGKTYYQVVMPDSFLDPRIGSMMTNTANLIKETFAASGFTNLVFANESALDPARPAIYLGDTKYARANGIDVTKYVDWTYTHKVIGSNLVIAGCDEPWTVKPPTNGWRGINGLPRMGTVKGVTEFLKQYAGVRFLYPGETGMEFLKMPVIAVPHSLNMTKNPLVPFFITYSATLNFFSIANNFFPPFDITYAAHTWDDAIPALKYRESHPEYFALINGQRSCNIRTGRPEWQNRPWLEHYCVSNPDVRELIYQHMLEQADKGYKIISLGQPDGFQPCQCEQCDKLYNTGKNWGEKIWILHRDLAKRLNKDRPGTKVFLLSYGLTWMPPETFKEFPPNAIIMLCRMWPDHLKAWGECKVPAGYAGYLYLWGTYNTLAYLPSTTPSKINDVVKSMHAFRVHGFHLDASFHTFGLEGPSYYTFGRTWDDPEKLQVKDILDEFYEGAFREASIPMRRFYETLDHAIRFTEDMPRSYEDPYGRTRRYVESDPLKLISFMYSPDVLAELENHLAKAEQMAVSEKVKRRLALVRLEFNYARHIATVAHHHNAFRIKPDKETRDHLLEAVDAWNAFLDSMFSNDKNKFMRYKIPGWPEMPIFSGHSHHAVSLSDWEPYKASPLCWDTKAMRNAPLPGARRLVVKPADEQVSVDSADWSLAAPEILGNMPGAQGSLECKTSFRALYDRDNFYLRAECEIPGTATNFPPLAEKEQDRLKQETLDIAIDPFGQREKFLRFIVNPLPEPRYSAANGFITDQLDPRYRKDDATWKGEWTYEPRLEPGKNRWLALVKIPFKTLGVDPPAAGASWKGNVARTHKADENRVERSIWSAGGNTRDASDREALAEIIFDNAEGTAAGNVLQKNPAREAREKLYKTAFEIPPEWKTVPNPLPTPIGQWVFKIDPADKGLKEGWEKPELNDSDWMPIAVPAFWAETDAGDYLGYGWYRIAFNVPAEWKGKPLRILFGSVDGQAWVYLNGKLVRERSIESEGRPIAELWDKTFIAEVKQKDVNYGGKNILAVRVHKTMGNAGIWRPVIVHAAGNTGQ